LMIPDRKRFPSVRALRRRKPWLPPIRKVCPEFADGFQGSLLSWPMES
jgi:hypothetical protein